MSSSPKHVLVGAGNPLLDISTECEKELLDKYGLKLNNAILAGPEHLPLYEELVKNYKVDYIAGGATQNTIRVAQWMAGEDNFAAYVGAIGKDEFGKNLKDAARADGVTTYYFEVDGKPTGTCAVLVNNTERSLVANLSAAEHYAKDHAESEAIQSVLKSADMFYSAGFFLTHAVDTMEMMGKIAAESGKIYAMNLSAPFLCQFFKEQMHRILPYADFVFGNESEAAAYAEANGFAGASVEDIALRISALPKASAARSRMVVITQGAEPTVIAQDGKVITVPVNPLEPNLIVDTNGAGDAFVGGFLAYIAKGVSPVEAAKAGNFAASHILQRSGCVFDKDAKYSPSA